MNQKQLKQLEANLWGSADNLRANSKLTAAEYKDPVLGLILLRYAQNRYDQAKATIEANTPVSPRGRKVEPTKEQFLAAGSMMLPELSQYEHLANLPEAEDISEAVNTAMRLIEEEYTDLAGILPRNYQELDATLLRDLIRVFNEDAVKSVTGDVFGRIYEYFLMKFSMSGAGAQEGGEFFTPPSLVQLIVNLIQPDHGIIHDPACGSGGMFVQTGHFLSEHKAKGEFGSINEAITCYGTELKSNNTRLAKMNLAIHGIEGKIIESNSFYTDPHNLVGKCDFVMANPPFNVNKVDKNSDFVKNDSRLFPELGIPKADNGNYLWIQYFYHYLNEKGRAGFVMASSATDAGNTEKAIRQQLIETGAVDCVVAVGNNFFYTRSLPCHVWFLNKGKSADNQDRILMIDARNTSRKVNTTLSDFSPGQLRNFSAIMDAYRGNDKAITEAKATHQQTVIQAAKEIISGIEGLNGIKGVNGLREQLQDAIANMDDDGLDFGSTAAELKQQLSLDTKASVDDCTALVASFEKPVPKLVDELEHYKTGVENDKKALLAKEKKTGKNDPARRKQLELEARQIRELNSLINAYHEQFTQSSVGEPLQDYKQGLKDWQALNEHFPEDEYRDIEGLCKIVDRAEVEDNDYSLTPGRYVGYSVQIDEDFDYQGRMAQIRTELAGLNVEANSLMRQIQNVEL